MDTVIISEYISFDFYGGDSLNRDAGVLLKKLRSVAIKVVNDDPRLCGYRLYDVGLCRCNEGINAKFYFIREECPEPFEIKSRETPLLH